MKKLMREHEDIIYDLCLNEKNKSIDINPLKIAEKSMNLTVDHMKGILDFISKNGMYDNMNGADEGAWDCKEFKGETKTTEEIIDLYFERLNDY